MIATPNGFQPDDFEDWFGNLRGGELFPIIAQLYQWDMLGKMNKKTYMVSLNVSEPRTKQQLSDEVLDKLSDYTAIGLLDDIIAARSRKSR